MSVIMTKQNMACALEPLPDDSFVQTYIDGPEGRWMLTTQHITRYREAVDWAVGIADQMAHPIHVVPISAAEFVKKHYAGLALLNDEQRGRLQRMTVNIMLEVLRGCSDPELRAEAHEVMTTLGVGQ